MRPLTSSLSPDEVASLIDVSPTVVHALMDEGRLLCRVHAGETRIPLEELETFFRDALLRVYRAEAHNAAVPPQSRPAVDEAPAPLPHSTPVDPVVPVAAEPEASEPAVAPSAPLKRPAVPRPDQRRAMRYVPRRQIDGIVDDVKFTILQISENGLRIRHKEPLLPGSEAKLTFALLKSARSVVIRTRVVWTSIARSGDERFSISGLRVIEHADRLEHAVETMRAAHELQPERRERRRRGDDAIAKLDGTSDEEIALVTRAIERFAGDPVEASRWYSRGRFALSEEHVRRLAPEKQSEREQVLAIWEYLERQVGLEKVAGVVAWTRGAN
jgi:hypothetical protein